MTFRIIFGFGLKFFGHEVGLDHDILDLDKGKLSETLKIGKSMKNLKL